MRNSASTLVHQIPDCFRDADEQALLAWYRQHVQSEVVELCEEVLELTKNLLAKPASDEARIFYLKMYMRTYMRTRRCLLQIHF
jgi:hypothetical protein